MTSDNDLREQLESVHAMSVKIASLHEMSEIHEQALTYCRELTASEFAFTGLLIQSSQVMDVVAIQGFEPLDENFYQQFRLIPVRNGVLAATIKEGRPSFSNDVPQDPDSVGVPPGHPPVVRFLGVPLRAGTKIIGMIGVANKKTPYGGNDERLLATFANQVAVAIDNAHLYDEQRELITRLQELHDRLSEAERNRLLASERQRIAGEFHDQIEQKIFSIGLGINALLDVHHDISPTNERLGAVRRLVVETSDEVRKAIFALAVPGHGGGNLAAEVRSRLRDLERRCGLETHLTVTGSANAAPEQFQEVAYSVIDQALTNVERHARARMILVSIRYEGDCINVVIQDDGVGVPDLVLNSFQNSFLHFGLRNMRQQVRHLGGDFEVTRGDDAGTIVRASLPQSQVTR